VFLSIFADRFSGAVVHLTTDDRLQVTCHLIVGLYVEPYSIASCQLQIAKGQNARISELTQAFQ
jgi:hypothetical protein